MILLLITLRMSQKNDSIFDEITLDYNKDILKLEGKRILVSTLPCNGQIAYMLHLKRYFCHFNY